MQQQINFSAFVTGVTIPERTNSPEEEAFIAETKKSLSHILKKYCDTYYIGLDDIPPDDITVIFETHNISQDTKISIKKYYHLNKLIFSCYFIINSSIRELECKIYKNF